jgi:hypothetical protein
MRIRSLLNDVTRLLNPLSCVASSQIIPKLAGSLAFNCKLDNNEYSCSSSFSFFDDDFLPSLTTSLTK